MAGEIERLEAAVGPQRDADTSIMTLVTTIVQLLKDAQAGGGTPTEVLARMNAVTDQFEANVARVAAFTLANTPQAG